MEITDLRLYVVTDSKLAGNRPLANIVDESLRGGAAVIQLREKDLPTGAFLQKAFMLKKIVKKHRNILFIINDRLDIALAAGADGVHLGQDDMPVKIAREILGPAAVIGLSVSSGAEARQGQADGADYLGVSAVFGTPTKKEAAAVGLAGLQEIRAAVSIPLVGIGGINSSNAAAVIEAGADGIAVVSEIMQAENPRQAAADLRETVNKAVELRKTLMQ